ncbi:conjugal transfer protein TraN [Sulfurimonas sp.]|uniref:conjugal transfer protein TraN n=1 Tax=Sulfurimonas sp. TaxID=2022749 RepID=UPI0025CC6EB8|nr:conjugal transfer protein TraN [Sulfurimonas sp.]MBW6487540.1 conjugal transfer protein TraN [Sulfurimonas sp.]
MKTAIKLLIFLTLTLNLNAQYICSTDQAFQDWLMQEEVDVNDDTVLTKYADITSCKSACRTTEVCTNSAVGGFTCPLYEANTDLGGDVDLNVFSNQSTCNTKCYLQKNCIPWTDNPDCTPVSFDKSNPVSDWTGKTVFTRYNISWDCKSTETLFGGCLAYEIQIIDDDTTFDLSQIGWESKEFNGHEEAMAAVAGMEQFQHIWSGWDGMCEDGIQFDSSFLSDPMTLLSFASMAYTGALSGAYGQAATDMAANATNTVLSNFDAAAASISGAATSASNAVSNAVSGVGDAVSNATDAVGFSSQSAGQLVSDSAEAVDTATEVGQAATVAYNATETVLNSEWANIQNFLDTELIGATSYTTAVTYGSATMDIAAVAMAAFSKPTEDDFQIADEYMQAQLGATDASIAAVNYAQCMAAVGLSFPNMMGHAIDSDGAMSTELREPWKNIITMSDNQLAYLMNATSEAFVRATYIQISHNGDIGNYIAITSLGYQQAGQVICGNGRIALAINVNSQIANDNSGINVEAMATAVLNQALTYLPPPYNLMASIALKIFTAISDGDACHDEDIAMKWGIQQYKTQKALAFNQCHYTDSECAAKWFWGSCMRDKHYYCCYDQEMTRIFVEGTKAQIPRGWRRNVCSDIELGDLKNISFRKCLNNEEPAKDKCFPADKWEELNLAIMKQTTKGFDAQSLTDMAIDSMPVGDDPWGPRVGD